MDPRYAAAHVEEDGRHWWFRGRQAVIRSVLGAALPRRPLRLAEIGCGSGGLLGVLAELGEVVGVEASPGFLEAARRRGFRVLPGSLPEEVPLPAGSQDAVLLFDVLEHIADDAGALRGAVRLLRPGGWLVLTVPAHRWLWSPHDEALGHHRRYSARGLRRLVEAAGLRPVRLTYFNTLLAGPVLLVRLLGLSAGDGHDLVRPRPAVNGLLARVFSLEALWLRRANLPFGISLLLVARRPE
jgi:SAM-dependent methyltransferase